MNKSSVNLPQFKDGQYIKQRVPFQVGDSIPSVFNYIDYEFTEEGVWQAFLLHLSWRYMPVEWHYAYAKNDYIFSMEDAQKINKHFSSRWNIMLLESRKLPSYDRIKFIASLKKHLTNNSILPSITIKSHNEAVIEIAYWNNWQGLVRKTTEIIKHNNTTLFREINRIVLAEFCCCIEI